MTTAVRTPLPNERKSITHKTKITDPTGGTYSVFLTVGLYEDGQPGELFIRVGKAGSTLNALMDTIGILWSFSLQYGIPLEDLCNKFEATNFSPQGETSNEEIATCTSIVDYIAKWMGRFNGNGHAPL